MTKASKISSKRLQLFEELKVDWESDQGDELKALRDGDPDPDLSLSARLRIAWLFSGLSGPKYATEVGIKKSTFQGTMSKMDIKNPTYIPAVVKFANSRRGAKGISESAFESRRFDGPNAPENFKRWLMGESPLGDGIELWRSRPKLTFDLDGNAPRKTQLDEIEAFLRDRKSKQIQTVYASDMSHGLTALADHLIAKIKADQSNYEFEDIVYLPMSYYVWGQTVELPQAVAWLAAFYSGDKMADAALPTNEVELEQAFAAIRQGMMSHRVLIIMDGAPDFKGVLPHLRALIADDAAAFMLRQMIHPHSDQIPPDMASFEGTKILLLSDGPYEALAPYSSDAIELALPSAKHQLTSIKNGDRFHGIREKAVVRERYRYADDLHFLLSRKTTAISNADAVLPILDVRYALRDPERQNNASLPKILTIPLENARGLLDDIRICEEPIFAVLAFLSLSIGGISVRSLMRVLRRWAKVSHAFGDMRLSVEERLPLNDLKQTLSLLDSILLQVDHSRSLDVPRLAGNFPLYDDDLDFDQTDEVLTRTLDFRTPLLRHWFAVEITAIIPPDIISLMQRFLAENAIHNHTLIARYNDRHDGLNARSHRRLVRALYHGFNSLGCDQHIKEKTRDLRFILPETAPQAFLRLYAIFYRKLLEGPPHWEMSRVMNAEAAKREILFLAMNASMRPSKSNPAITFLKELEPRAPDWLLSEDANDNNMRFEVIEDLLVNFARASVNLNHLESYDRVFEVWGELENRFSDPKFGLDMTAFPATGLIKARIDKLIILEELDEARTVTAKHLNAIHASSYETLENEIDELLKVANGRNRVDGEAGLEIERKLATAVAGYRNMKPALFADLLARVGEVTASGAESQSDPSSLYNERLKSFMWFFCAELIRRSAFGRSALSDDHVISGHQTREYIRIALNLADDVNKLKSRGISARYFFQKARAQTDILTRYFARYSSEKPGMLILEALFARYANDPDHALKLLAEAERRMVWTTDRPRLRMRLLLERAEILAVRSKKVTDPKTPRDVADKYAKAAWFDCERLAHMVEYVDVPLWRTLSIDLSKELRRLTGRTSSRDLKNGPD